MNFSNLLLGFDGRIGRQQFWVGLAIVTVAEAIAHFAFGIQFFPTVMKPLSVRLAEAAIELVTLYPTAAVVVKRLHDRNQPGGYAAWLIGISLILTITNLIGL